MVARPATAYGIAGFQLMHFDGPASAVRRLQHGDPFALRKVLVGRMKRYEVGSTHRDALDPRNPVFAASLQRCIGLIREAARSQT